jgi:hypothetical protein
MPRFVLHSAIPAALSCWRVATRKNTDSAWFSGPSSPSSTISRIHDSNGVNIRVHGRALYNSIYRFDSVMLVNTHVWGVSAFGAPVPHLRRLVDGGPFDTYAHSFESVWRCSNPAYGPPEGPA